MGILTKNEIYQIFQTIVIYEIFTLYFLYLLKRLINIYIIDNNLENTLLNHIPKILKILIVYLANIGMKTACIIATFIAILLVSDKFVGV